jgi:hypothetical protein
LILVAFELVRKLVVNRVAAFYDHMTFGEGLPFKTYEHDVLARHKHVFEASLLYLKDHFEAISAEDVVAIQALREHRNKIAHDLVSMLPTLDRVESAQMLSNAREALFRLSNFWVYIDAGADPEVKALNVDWDKAYGEDLILLDEIIAQTAILRRTIRTVSHRPSHPPARAGCELWPTLLPLLPLLPPLLLLREQRRPPRL